MRDVEQSPHSGSDQRITVVGPFEQANRLQCGAPETVGRVIRALKIFKLGGSEQVPVVGFHSSGCSR